MKEKNKVIKIYSLTPLQEGILYHSLADPHSQAYFLQFAFTLTGDLDVVLLEKSFNILIQRHDVLRTNFIYENIDAPKQVVFRSRMGKINYYDLDHNNDAKRAVSIEEIKDLDRQRGFDLLKDLLIRMTAVKMNGQNYTIILSVHHIILDGWCINLLSNELFDLYCDLLRDKEPQKIQTASFDTFINWLKKQDYPAARKYWQDYLEGYQKLAALPKYDRDGSDSNYQLEEQEFLFTKEITEQLKDFAAVNQVTLNTLIQSFWGTLLQRYNNTNDVVFGSIVSGRSPEIDGIESMIGLMINTIPVRIKSREDETMADLVKKVQAANLKSKDYDFFSLAEVQGDSNLKNGLFDHINIFENYPIGESVVKDGDEQKLGFSINNVSGFEQTHYNFNLVVYLNETLTIKFCYNANVYLADTVKWIIAHFRKLVASVVNNNDVVLGDIEILTDEETALNNQFNHTEKEYDRNQTIVELFERQADISGGRVAIVSAGKELTYRELDKKSNQLAHLLREQGVLPKEIIGIMMERSAEIMIAMLGVLKAGCAYLLIDPDIPDERINYMLENSNTGLLLVTNHLNRELDFRGPVVHMNSPKLLLADQSGIEKQSNADDLAYILYTSGSTGQPKGVMIEHQAVTNFIVGMCDRIGFFEEKSILALTTISFDIFFLETILPLVRGMKVVIASEESQRDPERIKDLIIQSNIDMLQVTPSRLTLMLKCEDNAYLSQLKDIMIGGEVLTDDLFHQLTRHTKAKVFNVYGPTETTIWSTVKELNRHCKINIGTPIANTRIYILGNDLRRQPIGVFGEICIAGSGLARGYIDKSLTGQKFIYSPFVKGELMYRTGDLGRWCLNGELEILGRMDNQVKIRGYRIELGEIESYIRDYEGVNEAAVLVKDDPYLGQCICAYVVSEEELKMADIRQYLVKRLPEYMIPAVIRQIPSMPLTIGGKVDKACLAKIKNDDGPVNEEVKIPLTNNQETLAKLWESLLGTNSIHVYTDFFHIGGHSLKATMLVSKIRKTFAVEISVKDIFEHSTLKEMTDFIERAGEGTDTLIQPLAERFYYPLSLAQKRLYILNSIGGQKAIYNMPYAVIINGRLDRSRLDRAFKTLVKRHAVFRSGFELINGEPAVKIDSEVKFQLEEVISQQQINQIIRDFIQPFDLKEGNLLRAKLVSMGEDRTLLMLDMHHIISDGASINLIIKELIELYDNRVPDPLRIQYQDFAAWQSENARSQAYLDQGEYWLKQFSGELPVLNMPTDFIRPIEQSFDGDRLTFDLSKELTTLLKALAVETGATVYMIILSIYNILLSKYTGQSDIIVGTPVAGRTNSELENMIGVFINTLAMRNYPDERLTFYEFLEAVKDNSIQAYKNQEYQFEDLINHLNLKREIGHNPLFDTMLLLQNMDQPLVTIEGVSFEPYEFNSNISKFDFSLLVREGQDALLFELEYCTRLFKKETMQRFIVHFLNITSQVVNNPALALSDIEFITEAEKKKILIDFNNTQSHIDGHLLIHQAFELQVQKTPDQIAVLYKTHRLSYLELNSKANQLGRALRKRGVGPGVITSIMVRRGPEMLIAILGVLKAGGGYVPVDAEYPEERIKYILRNAGCKVMLTTGEYQYQESADIEVIDLNDPELSCGSQNDLENLNAPDDPAYIIYTSGSTGNPKGVVVGHQAVINFVQGMLQQINFPPVSTVLALTTISFDIFVLETILPLLKGFQVVIADEVEQLDSKALSNLMESSKVDVIQMTPSRIKMFIQQEEHSKVLSQVKKIMVGGEAFPKHLLKDLNRLTNADIFNMYGPTETTVWSTVKRLTNESEITIGKPIMNTQIYILDHRLKLLPVGIVGELFIAGAGLAAGYYRNEDLTHERFIENPFNSGELIYRTGDLAKWLPNGEIEYVGRTDQQVKIRGYRIEIQEIEEHLKNLEGIVECAVVTKANKLGHQSLAAYYTAEKELEVLKIRSHLAVNLPGYMIPEAYYLVDQIPMTPNGKVDKKRLPEYDHYAPKTGVSYVAPETDIESTITAICLTLFNVEQVSVNDNFFDLGANSLLLIQMHHELEQVYPEVVTVAKLFVYSSIRKLAQYIEEKMKESSSAGSEWPSYPVLPDEYFYDLQGSGFKTNLKFRISGQNYLQIHHIAKVNGVDSHEVLQAIFLYLLTMVSKQKTITVSTILNNRADIHDLNIDFSKMNDFDMLYQMVNQQNKDHSLNGSVNEKRWYYRERKQKNQINALVYDGLLLETTKTDDFDIILRIGYEADHFECHFQYVNGKFSSNKIKALFTSYQQLVMKLLNIRAEDMA